MSELKTILDDYKKRLDKSNKEEQMQYVGKNFKLILTFMLLRNTFLYGFIISFILLSFSPVTMGQTIRLLLIEIPNNSAAIHLDKDFIKNLILTFFNLNLLLLMAINRFSVDKKVLNPYTPEELFEALKVNRNKDKLLIQSKKEYTIIVNNFKEYYLKQNKNNIDEIKKNLSKDEYQIFTLLEIYITNQ